MEASKDKEALESEMTLMVQTVMWRVENEWSYQAGHPVSQVVKTHTI